MATVQKIVPNLWFDTEAEEAAEYYTSIFKDSRVGSIVRYGESGPREAGMVMLVNFQLEGQDFTAINGGPQFKFNEAISLLVNCESQDEIDELWDKLSSDGGEPGVCGWLKDKFGVSWQIFTSVLDDFVDEDNPEQADRVMAAILGMTKIDIAELEKAAAG